MRSYRVTSKGQVTIPIEIRERLGLKPGSEVDFRVEGDAIRLSKAKTGKTRGEEIVEGMRGRAQRNLTTDEIMALTRGD